MRREWLVGLAVAVMVCAACNPGAGTGEAMGSIAIADCSHGTRAYDLEPTYFSAEGTLDALHIRIQRGGDVTEQSDGVFIDVQDAGGIYTALKAMTALEISPCTGSSLSCRAGMECVDGLCATPCTGSGAADTCAGSGMECVAGFCTPQVTHAVTDPADLTGVSMTLYLAQSCPAGIGQIATVLPSASGTVTFTAIYAPADPSSTTAITGHFDDVVFQIGTDPTRTAMLSGSFDFIYNRGRPAQRYP